jgi:hypothetical protein
MNKTQELMNFTRQISLDWINQYGKEIDRTQEYQDLISLFPPLSELFGQGKEEDPAEFGRTTAHTFHTLAVLNRISSQSFFESGLNQHELQTVYALADSITARSPLIMPLILWLHDIGKMQDKRHHTEKSAELVSTMGLLNGWGITPAWVLLITKVIQYHLLVGTLYSGEISYLSFRAIIEDAEFIPILAESKLRDLFIDALILFTMIDIWGYPYNSQAITAAMIRNYLNIAQELRFVLEKGEDKEETYERLINIAQQSADWRLACYLRAFSHLGTKPYLTPEFYQEKLIQGAEVFLGKTLSPATWVAFREEYLDKFYQIQFKYALGLLCLLSFETLENFRQGCTAETQVNPNLLKLLTLLNNKLKTREMTQGLPEDCLWEVYFTGTPLWTRKSNIFEEINRPGIIEEIVSSAKNQGQNNHWAQSLYLDFQPYWKFID